MFSLAGRLLRGEEKHARSRYEEDVLVGNHTAVWGSHWRDGAWGYACCHQFVKNSYCIGDAGAAAADEQTAQVRNAVPHLGPVLSGACLTFSRLSAGRQAN